MRAPKPGTYESYVLGTIVTLYVICGLTLAGYVLYELALWISSL